MSDLTFMVNIGREMSRKLRAVGITSPEQLREAGAMGAYLRRSEKHTTELQSRH